MRIHLTIIIKEISYKLKYWKRDMLGAGLKKEQGESHVIPF